MDALVVENLNKIYKSQNGLADKVALQNLTFKVKKGVIFGLLGPNGAGKSTLINILANTVLKTSGKAKIMGIDIDEDIKLAKKKIGVVPQELLLDTFFSVTETLELTAGYYGLRPHERKTEQIIDALGLRDKAHALPRELSGGMRRRLLVAKAMVHSPELLILDEPTAGVDIHLREQLWEYVLQLNKVDGTTIILTTHYLEEAEELCDDIGFINHGRLIACDSKKNLLQTLDYKELIITFSHTIDQVPEQLSHLNCKIIDKKTAINICYSSTEVTLNKILEIVQSSGLCISDIRIAEIHLEDVFKRLSAL